MALRWRESGELVCAAKSKPRKSDTYIDDRLHYHLSQVIRVIRPTAGTHGWHWTNTVVRLLGKRGYPMLAVGELLGIETGLPVDDSGPAARDSSRKTQRAKPLLPKVVLYL